MAVCQRVPSPAALMWREMRRTLAGPWAVQMALARRTRSLRDAFGFGDEELGVVAFVLEGCEDLIGEVAGVGVFEEGAVWGAFAGGVVAVGGV